MNQEQIWKDIPGYEGYYQVSNIGRVKSLERHVNAKNNSLRKEPCKILKPADNGSGYFMVGLCKRNKRWMISIHRLVCLSFIPDYDGKTDVNHKNGIKHDNRLDNLEWCTKS